MINSIPHYSVLKNEVVSTLVNGKTGHLKIVDGTLGYAGHAEAFLRALPEAEYLGIDRDSEALSFAKERLSFAGERVHFEKGTYSQMRVLMSKHAWEEADIILLDIGVSSPQIDLSERGFSYKNNGPLDMRMDQASSLTASGLLNTYAQSELVRIFREYGEVREAKMLAAAVVERRGSKPWETTHEFAALCDKIIYRPRHITTPSPTLPFQALRIAVNDELGELESTLPEAIDLLKVGGRLGVISFHSLEDRCVKHFFQYAAESCHCPPGLPVCCCHYEPNLKIVTKKPVCATDEELKLNSRSACAKLRVAEKI